MTASRQIFADFLSAEAGHEARRRLDPIGMKSEYFTSPREQLACSDDENATISRLLVSAEDYLAQIRGKFISLSNSVAQTEDAAIIRHKTAIEFGPFFVGTQYLLHGVCGNWNNEERYALTALRLHAIDVGYGQPRASRLDRYQEMQRTHSIVDDGTSLLRAAEDARISDGAFTFASKLIALSYFPESFVGEILGINLFLRHCGLLPPFALLCRRDDRSLSFLDLGKSPRDACSTPAKLSTQAVLEYIDGSGSDGVSNVCAGFGWARRTTVEVCEKVFEVVDRWLDPREAARQLIRRRREDASHYHAGTKIAGQMMTDLLKERDPAIFLDHLARSNFVRPGDPANSPLLNALISPRSKMFRIFNRYEVAVLHRWIKGLPYQTPDVQPPACQLWNDDQVLPCSSFGEDLAHADFRLKPRRMYQRLLHTEMSESENSYARTYVEKWLKRSANGFCPLPTDWRSGDLTNWLRRRHEANNAPPSDAERTVPLKEDVVADVCSLAPLTMIDGAWLAGFSHPSLASSESGFNLFEIFFDELGNGIHELNHPVIYRELMQRICGPLPPTSDAGYVNSPIFNDSDFDLPVFWLSIGKYPMTFRQEIMGLNLAMELSGVGAGYRRTSKVLASYGFPTTFVDLHNSIDNISTGHTAWAASSIDTYMSALPPKERGESWRRIRTGFAALNPPPPRRAVVDKIRQKLSSLL